jgi:hypothetical protein
MPYDWLNNQSGDRCSNPKDWNTSDICAESFKNSAYVCILKSKPKLYSEKSETHIPDLPEVQAGFLHFDVVLISVLTV